MKYSCISLKSYDDLIEGTFNIQFTIYIYFYYLDTTHNLFISFFFFSFSGMWDDDKASGLGTLEYSNGDLYEGEWENDQRNGNEIY